MCSSLLLLASGCPGDDGSSDAGGSSGSVGSSGTTMAATTADTGVSTGSTDSAGSSDATGPADSTDTGAEMCVDDPAPREGPSPSTITVQLLNDTEAPAYVLDMALDCTPFDVTREGEILPLANGYRCGCECPSPPPASYQAVVLDPGMTHVVGEWDGRQLATYTLREDCGEGFCVAELAGVPTAAPEGPATLTIPMYAEAGMFETKEFVGAFLERCPGDWTFTVDVELGVEDQLIEVLLSDVMP